MENQKFAKRGVTKAIEQFVNDGMQIDASHDQDFLSSSQYSWDDLNKLKEDLGMQIIEFIGQVQSIIANPAVISNLGDKSTQFQKSIELFFADINNFSLKVPEIRLQHENRTGHIDNLNDFNLYNRLAIQYQALFTELATLVSPTLADIMLTIADIVPVKVDEAVAQTQQQEGAVHE